MNNVVPVVLETVDYFGTELSLMSDVIRTGRRVGASKQFWQALKNSQELFREVREFVEAKMRHETPRPTFRVNVDYSLPKTHWESVRLINLRDAFEKIIKYPAPQNLKATLSIEIFCMYGGSNRENTMSVLRESGYRPIDTIEALCLISQHPDAIRNLCVQYATKEQHGRRTKSLLILHKRGDLPAWREMESRHEPDALKISLYDDDDQAPENTYFGLHWTSSDVSHNSSGFLIPAVRL